MFKKARRANVDTAASGATMLKRKNALMTELGLSAEEEEAAMEVAGPGATIRPRRLAATFRVVLEGHGADGTLFPVSQRGSVALDSLEIVPL